MQLYLLQVRGSTSLLFRSDEVGKVGKVRSRKMGKTEKSEKSEKSEDGKDRKEEHLHEVSPLAASGLQLTANS